MVSKAKKKWPGPTKVLWTLELGKDEGINPSRESINGLALEQHLKMTCNFHVIVKRHFKYEIFNLKDYRFGISVWHITNISYTVNAQPCIAINFWIWLHETRHNHFKVYIVYSRVFFTSLAFDCWTTRDSNNIIFTFTVHSAFSSFAFFQTSVAVTSAGNRRT